MRIAEHQVDAGAGRQQALERQTAAGWAWLRFEPGLEAAFRQQYRISVLPFRLTLIGTAAVIVALTPLLDIFLLHPPADFMRAAHSVQLLVMLPMLLLALLCSLRPRLQRYEEVTSLLALSAVAGGLLFQRVIGARYQVWVPTELVTVGIAGAFVMGGLGFWRIAPLAVLLLVAMAVCEFASYGVNPTTQYIVFGVLVQVLIIGLAGYLQERFARGAWLRDQLLQILATRDSLTGLLNFRAFEQRCGQLFKQSLREKRPVIVALLDLDYFKQYNDAYGHAAGNDALRRVAAYLPTAMRRSSDIQARLGGEEFVLAFYDVERDVAPQMLEELRAGIEALGIVHERSPLPCRVVTASIGAVWCRPGGLLAEAALQESDRCLYRAKDAGRNSVLLSEREF